MKIRNWYKIYTWILIVIVILIIIILFSNNTHYIRNLNYLTQTAIDTIDDIEQQVLQNCEVYYCNVYDCDDLNNVQNIKLECDKIIYGT